MGSATYEAAKARFIATTRFWKMANQMTVGELLDALKKVPGNAYIGFHFGGLGVEFLESYRGNYSQVSLVPGSDHLRALGLVEALEEMLVKPMTGYKGGQYQADRNTALWVSCHGGASGTMIVGLKGGGDVWYLLTEQEDADDAAPDDGERIESRLRSIADEVSAIAQHLGVRGLK